MTLDGQAGPLIRRSPLLAASETLLEVRKKLPR